jgi:uncharacterized membrane protein
MFEITYIHRIIIHFPIAIILVGFLVDVVSLLIRKDKCLPKMGLYLEVLGVLGALAAFITGHLFTGDVIENVGKDGQMHELFATLTLITIVIATFVRLLVLYLKKQESWLKYLAMGLFLLAAAFVSVTGHFGGMIVVNNM